MRFYRRSVNGSSALENACDEMVFLTVTLLLIVFLHLDLIMSLRPEPSKAG
jgi:hypothetical protein